MTKSTCMLARLHTLLSNNNSVINSLNEFHLFSGKRQIMLRISACADQKAMADAQCCFQQVCWERVTVPWCCLVCSVHHLCPTCLPEITEARKSI